MSDHAYRWSPDGPECALCGFCHDDSDWHGDDDLKAFDEPRHAAHKEEVMIAALYVMPRGPYYGVDGIEPWGLPERDAREYAGPHPVIAHPPCARWGRYWSGGPMLAGTPRAKKLGDDGGCFASALASVRRWGGVLEHPEASHAWAHHGLKRPPRKGGWIRADEFGGWTCCVEQGHYGHLARKATWLYCVGCDLPELRWGASEAGCKMNEGFHSPQERRRAIKTGAVQRLSKRQREMTPVAFRDLLIAIASTAPGGA